MNSRRKTIAIVVLIVLAAGAALAVAYGPSGMLAHLPGNPLGVTTTLPMQTMPVVDAQRLEQALNSADRNEQASALVPGLAGAYMAQDQPLLPPGAQLRIVAETFQASSPYGRVRAEATMPDGNISKYLLHLVTGQNGQWQILMTEGAQ